MPHLICGTNEGDIRNFIRDTKSNEVTMPRYILQIEQQLQSLLSANLTLTRRGKTGGIDSSRVVLAEIVVVTLSREN